MSRYFLMQSIILIINCADFGLQGVVEEEDISKPRHGQTGISRRGCIIEPTATDVLWRIDETISCLPLGDQPTIMNYLDGKYERRVITAFVDAAQLRSHSCQCVNVGTPSGRRMKEE